MLSFDDGHNVYRYLLKLYLIPLKEKMRTLDNFLLYLLEIDIKL